VSWHVLRDDDAGTMRVGRSDVFLMPWGPWNNGPTIGPMSTHDPSHYSVHDIWPQRTNRQHRIVDTVEAVEREVLTPEQRALVRMRYDEQMTQAAIAAALGITQQAVNQRLVTIHRRMRQKVVA
jgi:RNA polymerase sigma factor (sigma-70 family)